MSRLISTTRPIVSKRATDILFDTGETLLRSMVGFWDGSSYSGYGNWLNLGTSGSVGDLILGASTAAPTFSVDHFTFDGVNDKMTMGGDVNNFDALDKNNNFTFGIILVSTATPSNSGTYVHKAVSATSGWVLASNGTAFAPLTLIQDSTHFPTATSVATTSLGIKSVYAGGSNSSGQLFAGINGSVTSVTDTRTGSSTNTVAMVVGANIAQNLFQKMDLYGMFIHQGALSAQNYTDIGAHYGLVI